MADDWMKEELAQALVKFNISLLAGPWAHYMVCEALHRPTAFAA